MSLSRQPTPHPLGKCDTEVKTQVPEQLRDELAALAMLRGQTVSEYLREILTLHIRGHLGAIRLQQRVAEVEGDNAS